MPQPLSKLAPNLVPEFGPDAPLRRPELAGEAFASIHQWSSVDADLGNLLIDLLKADHHATLAVYQTFTSWGQKRQAVIAAASHALQSGPLELLEDILNAFKATRDRRNSLAHFVWGVHDDLPDALMCIDPKHLQKQWAHLKDQFSTFTTLPSISEIESKDSFKDPEKIDPANIQVWRSADFKDLQTDILGAGKMLNLFHATIFLDGPARGKLFDGLRSSPQIAQASQNRARQQKI